MAWMDIRAPRCPRIARALLVVPAACWGGYVQQLMFTPTNAEHASHQGYQCRLSKKQPYRRQFQERALKIKAAVRRIVSRSAQRDEITASFPPTPHRIISLHLAVLHAAHAHRKYRPTPVPSASATAEYRLMANLSPS
jgi:hypothetical protein